MKFLKIALATAAIAGFASTASAQDSNAYINIGVDAVEFDAYNISAKLGYNFNENLGIEGQGAFGIIDDKIDIEDQEVNSGVDSSFGAFLIGRIPAGENFDLFARAGYAFTKVGFSSGPVEIDLDFDGFAFGAGGQYWLNEVSGIRLEYTRYDNNLDDDFFDDFDEDFDDNVDTDFGADVITLSYVRKF